MSGGRHRCTAAPPVYGECLPTYLLVVSYRRRTHPLGARERAHGQDGRMGEPVLWIHGHYAGLA